jgi:hypothetical protein
VPRIDSLHLPAALGGFSIWFNSADHAPPHFHLAQPGRCELRVYFLRADMFELKWGRMPAAHKLRAVAALVSRRRAALLREWSQKVRP